MASEELKLFVVKSYKEAVDKLIDSPVDYCDGEPIKSVLKELTMIGKEIGINIDDLIPLNDREYLEEEINNEEKMWVDDNTYMPAMANNHMATDDFFNPYRQENNIAPLNNTHDNSSIEDKLKTLSSSRKIIDDDEKEPVGEWSTYELEEEEDDLDI